MYILIIILLTGANVPVTQEFSSLEACEAAKTYLTYSRQLAYVKKDISCQKK